MKPENPETPETQETPETEESKETIRTFTVMLMYCFCALLCIIDVCLGGVIRTWVNGFFISTILFDLFWNLIPSFLGSPKKP